MMSERGPEANPKEFRPALLANLVYGWLTVIPVSLLCLLLSMMGWGVVAKWLAFTFLLLLVGFYFPRNYLCFSLELTDEGFTYKPSVGRQRDIHWRDVSHYYIGIVWVKFLDERAEIPVLWGRPLLIHDADRFRRAVVENCPGAVRMSLIGWWRLVLKTSFAIARKS